MRTYRPMRLAPTLDPLLKNDLQGVDVWLRQLSTELARIPKTQIGTPAASQQGVSLTEYLYLPGRSGGQQSKQRVTFEAKTITAGGVTADPRQYGVGFRAYANSSGESPSVNFSIEETGAGGTAIPNREWIFPAFNTRGDTSGRHYFVDQTTVQRISGPKIMQGCEYEMYDVAGIGFSQDVAGNRNTLGSGVQTMNLIFAPNFTQCTWPYSSSVGTNGIQPHVYIPPLDIGSASTGGSAVAREKKHALAIVRTQTPNTPFEYGSLMGSSFSGRALYPMPTSAHGTFSVPTGGELPQYWPTITRTDCGLTTSSPTITTASTAGIKVGMRITPNISSGTPSWETFGDDVFVVGVTPGVSVTMSTNWSGGNVSNQTLNFFGPTWVTPTALAGTINHSSLAGLSADDHSQYLLLAGRGTGQIIGSGSWSGSSESLKVTETIAGGTAASAPVGEKLTISDSTTRTSVTMMARFQLALNAAAAGAGGIYRTIASALTGNAVSGSLTLEAANFSASPTIVAGPTAIKIRGLNNTATYSGLLSTPQINELSGLFNRVAGITGYIGDYAQVIDAHGEYIQLSPASSNFSTLHGVRVAVDTSLGLTKGVTDFLPIFCGDDVASLSGQFGSTSGTGSLSVGTPNMTSVSGVIANLRTGMKITGTGVPSETYILSINVVGASLVMTKNATSSTSGATYTFSGAVGVLSVLRRTTGFSNCQTAVFLDSHNKSMWSQIGPMLLMPTSPTSYNAPTAYLHIETGGTATAGTAPIKLTAGTNLTTAEAGAFEYDGTELYFTESTPTRQTVLATSGTSGAGASVGTLNNAPAAGDPTIWLPVVVGGATYYIPAW